MTTDWIAKTCILGLFLSLNDFYFISYSTVMLYSLQARERQRTRKAAHEKGSARERQRTRKAAHEKGSARERQRTRKAAHEKGSARERQRTRKAAHEKGSARERQRTRKAAHEKGSARERQRTRKAAHKVDQGGGVDHNRILCQHYDWPVSLTSFLLQFVLGQTMIRLAYSVTNSRCIKYSI